MGRANTHSDQRAARSLAAALAMATVAGLAAAVPASASPSATPRAPTGTATAAATPGPTGSLIRSLSGTTASPAPASPTAAPATPVLSSDAVTLQRQLQSSFDQAEQLSEDVNEAQARLAQLKAQLAAVDTRLTAAQARLEAASADLGRHARAAYMTGGSAGALLAVVQPDVAASTAYLTDHSLRADSAAVSAAEKGRDTVAALRAQRAAALADQQRISDQLTARRTQLEVLGKAITTKLATLDGGTQAALAVVRATLNAQDAATWTRYVQAQGGERAGRYLSPSAAAAKAVEVALSMRGRPYVWGATGPATFDCSGLVQYAYAAAGISLPRVSRDQWYAGAHVRLTDLLPGDLVFYANDTSDASTIHHVAMYIGNGLIVHAPHPGDVVRVAPIWSNGLMGAVRPTRAGHLAGAPVPPPDLTTPLVAPPVAPTAPAAPAGAPVTPWVEPTDPVVPGVNAPSSAAPSPSSPALPGTGTPVPVTPQVTPNASTPSPAPSSTTSAPAATPAPSAPAPWQPPTQTPTPTPTATPPAEPTPSQTPTAAPTAPDASPATATPSATPTGTPTP